MSQNPPKNRPNAAWEVGTTRLQNARPTIERNNQELRRGRYFELRRPVHFVTSFLLGLACLALSFGIWWFLTRGESGEERIISPILLPSPMETFESFPSLWGERNLAGNLLITMRRLVIGFGLAALVGIPIGVLAGCFPPLQAFLTPLILFGRNIPIAALIPLTFIFFGIAEKQKVIFIFLTCVAFIVADSASNVLAVGQQYIDTAYTLGAKRRHVIAKVLVPLAMPAIFDSLRLLFGLAFGYIMLAETVKLGGEEGGLGNLILMSQRRSFTAHIILIILIIPLVALIIDRCLFFAQRQLFPFRYGGAGYLKKLGRFFVQTWQSMKGALIPPTPEISGLVASQLQAIAAMDQKARSYEIEHLSDEARKQWRP